MLILECVNIVISFIFCGLFTWRWLQLRRAATTKRYSKYYPKLRIFFSVIFILFGVALLVVNVCFNTFAQWYDYLFEGGGGECLNSVTLLLQLFVLRNELDKEIPYTHFHLIYFIYLFAIECVRFVFNVLYAIEDQKYYTQLGIGILLLIDTTAQMSYWFAKKQSLPKFQQITPILYDQFKAQSRNLTILTQSIPNMELSKGDLLSQENQFLFLHAHVMVQNARIRVKIETNRSEQVSDGFYTTQDIMQLYSACGRLPLARRIVFADTSLLGLSQMFQLFLNELLCKRQAYEAEILRLLRLDSKLIELYGQVLMSGTEESVMHDRNACYVSVHIDRHLWVHDHYQFYIRVVPCSSIQTHRTTQGRNSSVSHKTHPMKRFSEFEDLNEHIKRICPNISLPPLPKKHLFLLNEERVSERKNALQTYIQKLCNDYTLISHHSIRQIIQQFLGSSLSAGEFDMELYHGLQIKKEKIKKTFVEGDYITFYEFKVYKNEKEICLLNKRFRQFVELHQDISRWKHNLQIIRPEYHESNIRISQLPEKHLFKSEASRHDKLQSYLQQLMYLKQIGKVYSIRHFFNIKTTSQPQESSPSNKPWDDQNKMQFSGLSHSERFSVILEDLGRSHL